MPISDAPKLRTALDVFKGVPALPGLSRVGNMLTSRQSGREEGARKRPWLLLGGMAGVLALIGAGLVAVAVLRPGTANRPAPAVAAAPATATADPLRRIRIVGEQLNLVTRSVDGQLFIYAGGPAGVQTALSLARSGGRDGPHPHVVSLPALSAAAAEAFREYGFDVTEQSVATDGPGIALTVKVPATLRPLHDALATKVVTALTAVPGLTAVHLEETVKVEDGSFLLATMVGRPVSRAFTAEGTKEVGDDVLKHFKLRTVENDKVELTRAAVAGNGEVRVVVPLHGESRLASGALDAVRPTVFAASILN